MPLLIAEADDLVLDTRAISRADAVDHSGIHGRAVEVFEDDAVRIGVRIDDVARHLLDTVERGSVRASAERGDILLAVLYFET